MNSAIFYPSALQGQIHAPASKSEAHRAFICAALADTQTIILMSDICADVLATISCLQAMGAKIRRSGLGSYQVTPIGANPPKSCVLNCAESGSTLRFLLPVCAAIGICATFTAAPQLSARPIKPLQDALIQHGITFSSQNLPFSISGKLDCGVFQISGDVSSQYLSGLMLASPLLQGSQIQLTTDLQSAPYISITRKTMQAFGINNPQDVYLAPKSISIGGDWSSSAFWLCAAAVSQKICVSGLDLSSSQGDAQILEILARFGAKIDITSLGVCSSPAPLHAISIDGASIPDLIPILAAIACFAEGETTISNISRLRHKESNRIESIISALGALGANIIYKNDTLKISKSNLHGGKISSKNDHRIAMMAAICACFASGQIHVDNIDCVSKSYSNFLADFKSLGGKFNVVNDGQQN